MNGARPASRKAEQPLSVSKQPSSASLQPDVQLQTPVVAQAPVQTPPPTSGKKKDKKKQKVEAGGLVVPNNAIGVSLSPEVVYVVACVFAY